MVINFYTTMHAAFDSYRACADGVPVHSGLARSASDREKHVPCTEVLLVFHYQHALAGVGELLHRWQYAMGEYVFVEPRIDADLIGTRSDGVLKNEQPASLEQTFDDIDVNVVETLTDMFEHVDRDDAVELTAELAIVVKMIARGLIWLALRRWLCQSALRRKSLLRIRRSWPNCSRRPAHSCQASDPVFAI